MPAAAPRTRILMAVTTEKADRLHAALQGHEIAMASTRAQALEQLAREDFGMVIIGVHFDESQMFNLLSDIRHHSRHAKVPILVMLARGRYPLSDVVVEAIDHAVKAMSANGLIDLSHFPEGAEGDARIRRIVDYLILIDGDLQHVARETSDPDLASLVERRRRA